MGEIQNETLDLSQRSIKRLEKATEEESKQVINLIIDNNELQRLDNLETYCRVEKLSISSNYLMRMYGVSKLVNIRELSLNNNGILQIEGLKDLLYLKVLQLAGNSIKSIEHLNNNLHLEYLDLSSNQISIIADISYLKNLKHLDLTKNRINELSQCDRYLPTNLQYLSISHNNINDLNEICHLVHLNKLDHLIVQGNPCLRMDGSGCVGFDYRPFVINWVMSLKTLDGYAVSAIESLKAEWLYSQGKGRHFSPGEHVALTKYLSTTCPLTAEALDTEDQRKLRLILTKAQHHQQQLQEQGASPNRTRINSPRLNSRTSNRGMDRMSSSYHVASPQQTRVMTDMSASCTVMSASFDTSSSRHDESDTSLTQSCDSSFVESSRGRSLSVRDTRPSNEPLEAASKRVPVLESLMSPDCQIPSFVNVAHVNGVERVSRHSSPALSPYNKGLRGSPKLSRSAMSSPKLKPKIEQRKGSFSNRSPLRQDSLKISKDEINKEKMKNSVKARKDNKEMEAAVKCRESKIKSNNEIQAAVLIQKMWRGYRIRNLHKDTLRILQSIQSARAKQHIERLTCDMEATKSALESERKIQQLQMQAINALWKKITALQTSGEKQNELTTDPNNSEMSHTMKHLTQTCLNLQMQVSELQSSMHTILSSINDLKSTSVAVSKSNQMATQTDITAVTTPQAENHTCLTLRRPQTLQLTTEVQPLQITEDLSQAVDLTSQKEANQADIKEISQINSETSIVSSGYLTERSCEVKEIDNLSVD